MRRLRGLVHAHTWRSFDSILPAGAYLSLARRAGLDFVCVTDHNTLAGSLELARRNRDPRLEIVIGAEYATERADILGLFLHQEVLSRRFAEVVADIHAQGGLVVLPHPYRHTKGDPTLYPHVDAIEVFNSRSSDAENERALADAVALGLPQLAGADTHTAWELLRGGTLVTLDAPDDTTSLRDLLLSAPRTLETRRTHRNLRRYSQVIKRIRRRAGLPGAS